MCNLCKSVEPISYIYCIYQGSKIGRSDSLRPVENCNGPTEYTRYKSDRTCSTYTNNIKVAKQELVYV